MFNFIYEKESEIISGQRGSGFGYKFHDHIKQSQFTISSLYLILIQFMKFECDEDGKLKNKSFNYIRMN
jgi:hypothetical protein